MFSSLFGSKAKKAPQPSAPQPSPWTSQQEADFMPDSDSEVQKLFADMETGQERLVGVIVTICAQGSYDENFREVRPETVPGEKVAIYSLNLFSVAKLHEYLLGGAPEGLWREMVHDIRSVAPDSVTFNWECCGACGDAGFQPTLRSRAVTPGPSIHFIAYALKQGFSVMCSDFSLKALIVEWSEELLGPNPFSRLPGSCDMQFRLDFFPKHLTQEDVPQQLQVVGELCHADGKAVVGALSDTILYTVNPLRQPTDTYDLKVLTVVTECHGTPVPEAMQCEVQEGQLRKRGAAGHVCLTYKSGGQLITSMGHWIELSRIDTSVESLMQVAARNFGQEEIFKQQAALREARSETERQGVVQRFSKQMIQKSVPSSMKGRTKF